MAASTLLIDDDEGLATSLVALFKERGLALDWVPSWEAGVASFKVGLHELVIADYHLPGSKHGLQLLAQIKPLRPSSRLILISGVLMPDADKVLGGSRLVDRYLPKTSTLPGELVEEAEAAEERAQQQCDWTTIAKAHLAGKDVAVDEVDRLDAVLQNHVSRRTGS